MPTLEEVRKEAAKLQDFAKNFAMLGILLEEIEQDSEQSGLNRSSYLPKLMDIDYSKYAEHSHGVDDNCVVERPISEFVRTVINALDKEHPTLMTDQPHYYCQSQPLSPTGIEASTSKKPIYRNIDTDRIERNILRPLGNLDSYRQSIKTSPRYHQGDAWHTDYKSLEAQRKLEEKGYLEKTRAIEKLVETIQADMRGSIGQRYESYLNLLEEYANQEYQLQKAQQTAKRDAEEGSETARLENAAGSILNRIKSQLDNRKDKDRSV